MKREIHKIDATERVLGRLASEVAVILRGKNKPSFQLHLDEGDFVEIANIDKMKITGKKLDQKKYYRHSGYPGRIKEKSMKEIMEKNPSEVFRKAVFNMLPKNKLRNEMMKRLTFIK